MPLVLQFPMKKVSPEQSLERALKKFNEPEIGFFGIWYAQATIGKNDKWMNKLDRAKIDTGASISLFPEKYASELKLGTGTPYQFYGVNRKDDCLIDVIIRRVDLKIYDFNLQELVLRDIWIAFSKLEHAPILLGVKDILEHMRFGFLKENNTLTLEYLGA